MEVRPNYLLQALDFCHNRRIIHRDLKPQNLLIDKQVGHQTTLDKCNLILKGVIKLADFGLARAFNYPMRAYTHEVVTMWYRSPEILLGKQVYSFDHIYFLSKLFQRYACPTDMWSLGCIFYEMLTNNALFCGDSEIDQIFKVYYQY